MKTQLRVSAAPLVIACALAAMSAAGCSRTGGQSASNTTTAAPLAALPLTTEDTGPVTLAPALTALKPAPPAMVTRLVDPRQRYAYLDRAYALAQTYGDAPPDYTYDYGGTRPWVWRGDDGSERVAERTPDGLRYYYYDAGAQYPYLVEDPDYTYGYSNGELVAVYRDGALLSNDDAQRRADIAGRYLARASGLYEASVNQQHLAVAQSRWEAERAQIAANQARWSQEQSRYADWQAYHQDHVKEYQDHFAVEQYRRDSEAARYAQSVNDQAAAAQAMQAARQAQAAAHRSGQDIGPPPLAAVSAPARAPSAGSPIGGGAGPGGFGHDQPTQMQAQQPPMSQGRNDAARDAARPNAVTQQAQARGDAARQASIQAAAEAHAHQAADMPAQQAQGRARAEAAQQDAARQAQAQARAQAQASAQAQSRSEAARQASAQAAASARAAHAEAMGAQDEHARAETAAAQQAAARQAQGQVEAQAAAARQAQAAAANAERARPAAAAHAQQAAKPDRPHPPGAEPPRVGEDKHP
jgi:hypothetical protein